MNGAPIAFDNQALEFIAATYNTGIAKAPLVLGHPADNQPSFGEVRRLVAKHGNLYAHIAPNQALVDMVRAGLYRNVSASFYAPSHPTNPAPGLYFLRHLGFLGAHPPAVKGLEAIVFCAPTSKGLDFAESEAGETASLATIKQFQSACPGLDFCEAARMLGL